MNRNRRGLAAVAAAALALAAGPAAAIDRVDAKDDWSIFEHVDSGKKVCWIASQPTSSVARRGGKPVQVQRGDIYLMTSVWPSRGTLNEVSMVSGYPFRKDSTVEAKVGSDEFEMFTDGEGAWLASPEEDDKMVAAMKKGATAVLTGVSARGTTTVDTFSLIGFTAALETAQERCK